MKITVILLPLLVCFVNGASYEHLYEKQASSVSAGIGANGSPAGNFGHSQALPQHSAGIGTGSDADAFAKAITSAEAAAMARVQASAQATAYASAQAAMAAARDAKEQAYAKARTATELAAAAQAKARAEAIAAIAAENKAIKVTKTAAKTSAKAQAAAEVAAKVQAAAQAVAIARARTAERNAFAQANIVARSAIGGGDLGSTGLAFSRSSARTAGSSVLGKFRKALARTFHRRRSSRRQAKARYLSVFGGAPERALARVMTLPAAGDINYRIPSRSMVNAGGDELGAGAAEFSSELGFYDRGAENSAFGSAGADFRFDGGFGSDGFGSAGADASAFSGSSAGDGASRISTFEGSAAANTGFMDSVGASSVSLMGTSYDGGLGPNTVDAKTATSAVTNAAAGFDIHGGISDASEPSTFSLTGAIPGAGPDCIHETGIDTGAVYY